MAVMVVVELLMQEKQTARQTTGRGARCEVVRMLQSLIRSHANGPDPEDVTLVRMVVMDAEQTHWRNVTGR
jgi:hypothetical protein